MIFMGASGLMIRRQLGEDRPSENLHNLPSVARRLAAQDSLVRRSEARRSVVQHVEAQYLGIHRRSLRHVVVHQYTKVQLASHDFTFQYEVRDIVSGMQDLHQSSHRLSNVPSTRALFTLERSPSQTSMTGSQS